MSHKRHVQALEDLMDNLAEHELMMEEKYLSDGASIEDVEYMRSNYERTQMCLESKYKKLTGKFYKIRKVFGGD